MVLLLVLSLSTAILFREWSFAGTLPCAQHHSTVWLQCVGHLLPTYMGSEKYNLCQLTKNISYSDVSATSPQGTSQRSAVNTQQVLGPHPRMAPARAGALEPALSPRVPGEQGLKGWALPG